MVASEVGDSNRVLLHSEIGEKVEKEQGIQKIKCRNKKPTKQSADDDHLLYTSTYGKSMTYSGAHLRPCSRNPIPHSSAPSIKVESLYIPKSGSPRGVNELNCRGVALTTLAGKKGNKHKTGEDHTCNKVTGLHPQSGSPGNVRGARKSGASILWGKIGLALCGDLRKFGSLEGEAIMADVSGMGEKWSRVNCVTRDTA